MKKQDFLLVLILIVIFFPFFVSDAAVSYTHLDVYKRQVLELIFFINLSEYLFVEQWNWEYGEVLSWLAPVLIVLVTSYSVSYTHLVIFVVGLHGQEHNDIAGLLLHRNPLHYYGSRQR